MILEKIKNIFSDFRTGLILLVLALIFSTSARVFAVPYVPSDNITDPSCSFGSTDCFVAPLSIGETVYGSSASGSVLFIDSSNKLSQDNSNFYWDDSTNRLGIGTNSPDYRLDIATTVGTFSSVGDAINSGTGLDDLTSGGSYNGLSDDNLDIYIDSLGTPDTFGYTSDSGNYEGSLVPITAGEIELGDGITITFGATTGHDSSEFWEIELTASDITSSSGDLNFGGAIYKNGTLWSGLIGGRIEDASGPSILFTNASGNLSDDSSFSYTDSTNVLTVDNVRIPTTSSTAGIIYRGGSRFLHSYGTDNTFLGAQAGNLSLTTASAVKNTSVGATSLDALTTGDDNVAVGYGSLGSNTIGVDNVAIGMNSLIFNVSGNSNTAVGRLALQRNTGSNNVAMGSGSFQLKGLGDSNVGIGTNALFGGSTNYNASYNVGIGYSALLGLDTGADYNIAIGESAGSGALTGDLNIFIGRGSGDSTTSGASNVILGADAAPALNTGSNNLILGSTAATTLQSGSRNIIIGDSVNTPASGTSDYLSVGDIFFGDLSTDFAGVGDTTPNYLLDVEKTSVDTDIFSLTDSDGSCLHNPEAGSEVVTCSSDERLKENIVDADSSLDEFMQFKIREYDVIASGDHMTGVIAQEVQEIFPHLVSEGANGFLMVSSPSTWNIIKAIQELKINIDLISSLDTEEPGSLGSLIKSFLSDAGNTIEVIFVKRIRTEELCLEDLCITKADLQSILEENNTNQNNNGGDEIGEENPIEQPEEQTPEDDQEDTGNPEQDIFEGEDGDIQTEDPQDENTPVDNTSSEGAI